MRAIYFVFTFRYLDSREVNLVQHLSKEPRFADIVPTFYYAIDDPGKVKKKLFSFMTIKTVTIVFKLAISLP